MQPDWVCSGIIKDPGMAAAAVLQAVSAATTAGSLAVTRLQTS